MSNYEYANKRQESLSPLALAQAVFPGESIDEALPLDSQGGPVVALCGLERHLPFLEKCLQKPSLNSVLSGLCKAKAILIDVKNKQIKAGDETIPFNQEIDSEIDLISLEFDDYGGRLNEKGEQIIDLKSPVIGPHYAVNLLLGDRSHFEEPLLTTPKAVVDQYGGGSFRGPSANQVLATSWGMDPFENGYPANRQFYLLENGKQIFYSHDVHTNVKEATCLHKVNETEIDYLTEDGLSIKRHIYIRAQEKKEEPIATERQVVEIANLGSKERDLTIVFTGMFGSANPGCQMVDVIYQTVINQTGLLRKDGKAVAIFPDYYPKYAQEYIRFFSLGDEGFDHFTYDLSSFVGTGSLMRPENISFLDNALKVKGPSFFAVDKRLRLAPGAMTTIVGTTGLIANGNGEGDLAASLEAVYPVDWKKEVLANEERLKKYSSFLQIKTGDRVYDSYVNRTLPFQVLYQTYVSRAFAQTQKGYREIGFREIQDLYASMYYFIHEGQSDLVKTLLGKWIVNVFEMGYANHNFFFEGKEPGMCSDDQIWLIEAVYRYVFLTHDLKFLDQIFPVAGSTKKRSLWETLQAIITYSGRISVGAHGIPLLDKADWNDCLKIDDDCLDGPSKEKLYRKQIKKKGQPYGVPFENHLSESVMNGFLLVIALRDMISLAGQRDEEDYASQCESLKTELSNSLRRNAYINGYYARVLINRGGKYSYVGAPGDGLSLLPGFDGSIYLNSLSWSILSGVASEGEIRSMVALADQYLKSPAGYVLCTPHDLKLCGSKEAATEQYFLGDRENGGVFKHATMMFAVAVLKASKAVEEEKLAKTLRDDADFMMDIVYPFNVLKDPYLFKGNPRFCTQYVNSITREHIGPILSGTATWLTLAILEKEGLSKL